MTCTQPPQPTEETSLLETLGYTILPLLTILVRAGIAVAERKEQRVFEALQARVARRSLEARKALEEENVALRDKLLGNDGKRFFEVDGVKSCVEVEPVTLNPEPALEADSGAVGEGVEYGPVVECDEVVEEDDITDDLVRLARWADMDLGESVELGGKERDLGDDWFDESWDLFAEQIEEF